MAAVETAGRPSDRQPRRRPFTSWVKRLTNLKSSDLSNPRHSKSKKAAEAAAKNNPYPQSGSVYKGPASRGDDSLDGHLSFSSPASHHQNGSLTSFPGSENVHPPLSDSNKSAAPTVATNPETVHSDAGLSKALTTKTGGALSSMDGVGANSTFSSPNQSEHSLATTLTTIQSTSPGNVLNQAGDSSQQNMPGPGNQHFTHQYPVNPTPASAIPPHMAPTGHPFTYNQATANNLLTDDASIMTLASSSKRNRRRSMDTDASVRAMAPSSVWGGSRESLPLSVLSGHDHQGAGMNSLYVQNQNRANVGGIPSTERASVYSSQSIGAPALASERNSYYASNRKQDKDARSMDGRSLYKDTEDGKSLFGGKSLYGGESLKGYEGSMRSGALGHGRNDSIPGSATSPLASPAAGVSRPLGAPSRRSSSFKAGEDDPAEENEDDGEKIALPE